MKRFIEVLAAKPRYDVRLRYDFLKVYVSSHFVPCFPEKYTAATHRQQPRSSTPFQLRFKKSEVQIEKAVIQIKKVVMQFKKVVIQFKKAAMQFKKPNFELKKLKFNLKNICLNHFLLVYWGFRAR